MNQKPFFVPFAFGSLKATLNITYFRNNVAAKSTARSISQRTRLRVSLVRQRQVVPVARDTTPTLWVCTWPLSLLGKTEKKEGGKVAEAFRSPSDSASYFNSFFSFICLFIFFFPLGPRLRRALLVSRGWQQAQGALRRSASRSQSATLDGVCLCPGDGSASARVWGTLSDDSECVIYELWKGCISSTRGRPHGKWRNSEFINIQ